MENKPSEMIKEKTVYNFLAENDEMIYKVKYLVEQIKNNILGSDEAVCAENPSPNCMFQLLEIENYNLKYIVENLEMIIRTLKPNN